MTTSTGLRDRAEEILSGLEMLRIAVAEGDPKGQLLVRVGDLCAETRALLASPAPAGAEGWRTDFENVPVDEFFACLSADKYLWLDFRANNRACEKFYSERGEEAVAWAVLHLPDTERAASPAPAQDARR